MPPNEWTKWSRVGSVPIVNTTAGSVINVIEANWDNGYLISGGLEWDVNEQFTLRAGYGFEKSPIQTAKQRLVSVPDSDRHWVSLGATMRYNEKLTFHAAYSHLFFDSDRSIDRRSVVTGSPFTGESDGDIDIISLGGTFTF